MLEPEEAVRELVAPLRAAGLERPDALLFGISGGLSSQADEVVERLSTALGGAPLVGGTALRLSATSLRATSQAAVVLALKAERGAFGGASLVAGPAAFDPFVADRKGLRWLALHDPRQVDGDWIPRWGAQPAGTLVGAGVSPTVDGLFLVAGDAKGEGGAALLAIPEAESSVAVASGIAAHGGWLTVSESQRHLVTRLDGMPAIEAFHRAVRAAGLDESTPLSLLLFALVLPPDAAEGAIPVVRPITGIERNSGALAFSVRVDKGSRLAFGMRDAIAATRARAVMCARLRTEADARGPITGLLWLEGEGRAGALFPDADADGLALDAAFPGVPRLGLTTSFELGPWGAGSGLSQWSGVALAFHGAP